MKMSLNELQNLVKRAYDLGVVEGELIAINKSLGVTHTKDEYEHTPLPGLVAELYRGY